jgi:large subunit ribosomal protein L30
MLAVIRLRGDIGVRRGFSETMKMLGLKRIHTLAVLPRTDAVIGMIKRVEGFVTWGELSPELEKEMAGKKTVHLKPPKGGIRAKKKPYPKGDLGYRGKEINDLIKRMV